jgi:hypothetical protein
MARGDLDETPPRHATKDPDDEHLQDAFAAFGLVPDRPVSAGLPEFYLWPENVDAWQFFRSCGTQWRHGFNGPTGLDYAGVEVVMERRRIPRRRRHRLWQLVWAMEGGALAGWAERRAEEDRRRE